MKLLYATGLAIAFTAIGGQQALAQTDQITGGYTAITFTSEFIAFTEESGIALSDLGGNALQNSTDTLSATQGAIDLQTGVTNVIFRGGLQASYTAERDG